MILLLLVAAGICFFLYFQGELPWAAAQPAGTEQEAKKTNKQKKKEKPAPPVVQLPEVSGTAIAIRYLYKFDPKVDNPKIPDVMCFGLTVYPGGIADLTSGKKLTFSEKGSTNSTLVKSDGGPEEEFGSERKKGVWVGKPTDLGRHGEGKQCTWLYRPDAIEIVQKVERVPGEPYLEDGVYKRRVDTCLVRYELHNKDKETHTIALRMLLDTSVGKNDGGPYTVPGKGLVDTKLELPTADAVPAFIQAMEYPDFQKSGIVAQLNLRIGGGIEPPDRVLLTHWEEKTVFLWEVPLEDMERDSCVVMYWERKLEPGQVRTVGYSYGLGNIATGKGNLGIAAGGNLCVGGDIDIVCYISQPQPDEKLTLLPCDGLKLDDGSPAEHSVGATGLGALARPNPISWRVRGAQAGSYDIEVRSSTGASQRRRITVRQADS
jgi:hypothetical protein